ncbi:heavy metal translocating P-type ATPase (plasmid) [Phenylobacterium zucineum HLK1]|uniref:Heavy metal translocating P-type ATPase n=1 Tax=Phenylobacterium zucineum (strain HLK1) TaxID=450851 RepID=B4RIL2_PHEZH|nr:heavy metal translocating P-type ATPase [Phenylobacterium zucineum]ACG80187.1 heavy metal translocating P-type ATPase [Phenylobacterium zucineum HLK1]
MAQVELRLPLESVLGGGADLCERCVGVLTSVAQGHPAVAEARVEAKQGAGEHLLIRFDGERAPPSQLRAFIEDSGAVIAERFGHFVFRVGGAIHPRMARRIRDHLRAQAGVIHADVRPVGRAFVEFDREKTSEAALLESVRTLGVELRSFDAEALPSNAAAGTVDQPPPAPLRQDTVAEGPERDEDEDGHAHGQGEDKHEHAHAHGGIFGERTELIFALLAGAVLAAGWLIERRVAGLVPLAFYVAAYVFGGFFTVREAFENLRQKRFEIDTLMLVAAAGAASLGAWAEGALLLFLFSLGHALEHYAMGRARRAIEALAELAPERATVRRGTATEEVPVEALEIGDVVIVRPNERLPADGVVIAGASSVNQAPITGESVPVDKAAAADAQLDFNKAGPEHRVFAGTINGAGVLEVRVARRATETTLARVVKMVAEAETQRSPTQRFTDRFQRIFVPVVLGLVGLLMFAWLVRDEPFSVSFYRAMAVLVAASPCALAISVPSAVLSGVARAARGGVLVKGGGPLENLGSLTALAFDKTGTLTEGKPRLTDVDPADGVSEQELLAVAVAVEALSDHPLAAAIARDGAERLGDRPSAVATDVRSLTGQGVQALVDGAPILIGKPAMFDAGEGPRPSEAVWSDARRLERNGRTVVMVRKGDRYLGSLGLMDTPRPPARQVIERLRALGIERILMLSGDNQSVADAIAQSLKLDEAKGGLMPEDKVRVIQELTAQEGRVAMVGDGVNDAPALANATVGIAMGAAGSDVALETADVALMADDLNHLPFAVGLSRRTSRVIKQNLWVSLGVVAFLIPATLFGLKIGVAVLFHEGSTVLVVANALRLLAYKDRDA